MNTSSKHSILVLADPFSKPSFAPRLRYLCAFLEAQGYALDVYTEQWDTIPFEHSYPIHEIRLMKGGAWAIKAMMNILFDWKSRVFTRHVRRLTADKKYNLVFCTTFSTFPLKTALSLARDYSLPLIVDIRDLDEQVPGAQYQYHRSWWARPWRKFYQAIQIRRRNSVLRKADAITTISPWHRDFLLSINPNINLIYNGFDPESFYPVDIRAKEFLISYIGRIYEFQDLQLLRSCIEELHQPDIHLNLHTPDHLPLPLHEVGNEIRRSSIMVVLTNREAKGMLTTKFFEALGCEKPVLCIPDDQGTLSQTIRTTRAGLSSDDKDTIKSFILDKYNEWKHNGYTHQYVDQDQKHLFSRRHQAEQFRQLFTDTITPMISVIVPVYNASAYLQQCLQSIVNQDTHARIQIIVIDDSSTDTSQHIAQQFAEQHAHCSNREFILLSQPHSGQSAARNLGITHAKGQYICYVDADDYLSPDFLSTHLQVLLSSRAQIVQSGYRRVTDIGKQIAVKYPRHRFQFTVPWARLYRREVVQDILFPEGMIYEDIIFSMNLWSKHPECQCISYTGYNYRINSSSTTSRINPPAQDKVFDTIHTTHAPWWLKLYTIIRLKLHFANNRS